MRNFYLENHRDVQNAIVNVKASTDQTIINFLLRQQNIEINYLPICYNLQDLQARQDTVTTFEEVKKYQYLFIYLKLCRPMFRWRKYFSLFLLETAATYSFEVNYMEVWIRDSTLWPQCYGKKGKF